MSKSNTRTNRQLKYEMIRDQMRSLGYNPLRKIFLDSWMRYRLIIVAVNHLATVLHRDPQRVYMALLCRAENTVRGTPFMPNRQAQIPQEAPGEGDGVGVVEKEVAGLDVDCPWCGKSLLGEGD